MADGGLPVERLRGYLQELKPEARALLVAELERGLQRGNALPGAELILQELRRPSDEGEGTPGLGGPERLFFKPLDPFLLDAAADHKHRARIARASLVPIWNWIGRDVMPAETTVYCREVERALTAKDTAKADGLAKVFQDQTVQRIQQILADTQNDDKARRRLTAQVGTPRASDDVMTLFGVLKARDALAAVGGRLPIPIKNLADDQLANIKTLLDPYAARNDDTFVYMLLLVMSRLAAAWQLVRLATFCAVSDDASRVAESQYARAVTIVLAEVERTAAELKTDLKSGRAGAAALKSMHDALRGLRTELDIAADSPWGRQLAAIRTEISGRLKAVVDSMPGRVRRLLRLRAAKEIPPGLVLDLTEVAETETLIEFVAACKTYANELAVNEMTLRTYSELQHYLDTRTPALVESLRNGGEAERVFRRSQVDAAVRFCAKVFGQEYAATLAKSAEVAANSERKAAEVS
jgi:hypothetical protein